MKISSNVSVIFRQIGQVSEFDFTPIYGYEVVAYGRVENVYNWNRSGLKAALKFAQRFLPSNSISRTYRPNSFNNIELENIQIVCSNTFGA